MLLVSFCVTFFTAVFWNKKWHKPNGLSQQQEEESSCYVQHIYWLQDIASNMKSDNVKEEE